MMDWIAMAPGIADAVRYQRDANGDSDAPVVVMTVV